MDPSQPNEFARHESWRELDETISIFQIDPDTDRVKGYSFSGSERNRLFLRRGDTFKDVSLVSGIDFKEDGRGFVLLDFDNDGDLDIGVVSNQSPRFRLVENKLADDAKFKSVKVLLEGGNRVAKPRIGLSPRDSVAAKIIVISGTGKRMFQLNCGEGFSVQNSRTVHIGVGDADSIAEIQVRWPSGKTSYEKNVKAGNTIRIVEP